MGGSVIVSPANFKVDGSLIRGKKRRLSMTLVDSCEPDKEYIALAPPIVLSASEYQSLFPHPAMFQLDESIDTGHAAWDSARKRKRDNRDDNKSLVSKAPSPLEKMSVVQNMATIPSGKQTVEELLSSDDMTTTSSAQAEQEQAISEEDLKAAGRKIMDLFTLERRFDEETRKRDEETRKRDEKMQAELEETKKRDRKMQAELEETKKRDRKMQAELEKIRAKMLFSFGGRTNMFVFICDVMENILVKLSYALQRILAQAIQVHIHMQAVQDHTTLQEKLSFQPAKFKEVFDERNLACLCYARVLKRWLKLWSVSWDQFLEQLLDLVKEEKRKEKEKEREEREEEDEDEEMLEYEEEPEEEEEAEQELEEKQAFVLQEMQTYLELAEKEVAEEFGVAILDLRITAACYILRLKRQRNVQAHQNQLYLPPSWRAAGSDESPITPKLIKDCMAPPTESNRLPVPHSFYNVLMLDVVDSKFKEVLSDDRRYLSKTLMKRLIRMVRSRVSANIASEFLEKLVRQHRLPSTISNLFNVSVYGNKKAAASQRGWIIQPLRMPEFQIRLSRRGEWMDLAGRQLETPFQGWPIQEICDCYHGE